MSSQRELMYLKVEVQHIMHRLIEAKADEIAPAIDLNAGQVSYPMIRDLRLDSAEIGVLEGMAETGILEKSLHDNLLTCPVHPDSLAVGIRLYCPKCRCFDILRMNLVEHKLCGFIATKEEFEKNNLVCPQCNAQIKNPSTEVSFPGLWHECRGCKAKFDAPEIVLRCRKHSHDFTINEAKQVNIYAYKLNKDAGKEFYDSYMLVIPLRKILEPAGFKVEAGANLKGKSGESHNVTLYARGNGQDILIDAKTAEESEVPEQFLIAMLAKVVDINPKMAFFVAMPAVSEKSKALATSYKIVVVEGKTVPEIMNGIVKNLKLELKLDGSHQVNVKTE